MGASVEQLFHSFVKVLAAVDHHRGLSPYERTVLKREDGAVRCLMTVQCFEGEKRTQLRK